MNLLRGSFLSLPLEIIKLLVIVIANNFASSQWTENTLFSISLVIGSMIIYSAITIVFQFKKAIAIKCEMKNKKTTNKMTQVHESSKEKELTIDVNISAERRMSFFSKLALIYIRNKKVLMKVSTNSDDIVLTPKYKRSFGEISEDIDGFKVDITDLLLRNLKVNKAFCHLRSYEFLISLKRSIDTPRDKEVQIFTSIILDNRSLFLFGLLFKTEIDKHKVYLYD